MSVFVILWRYGDGSANGVVGVYADRSSHDHVMKLMNDFGLGRQFEALEMPVIKLSGVGSDVAISGPGVSPDDTDLPF